MATRSFTSPVAIDVINLRRSWHQMARAKGELDTLLVTGLERIDDKEDAQRQADDLLKAFQQHGEVEELEVLRDGQPLAKMAGSASRGFAMVRMRGTISAGRAKAALDGTRLPRPGCSIGPIKVRFAIDRATIIVHDLGPNVKTPELREAFAQFGNVIDCRVERDPPELGGRSKGFGFVEFAKRAIAARVHQLCNQNLFLLSSSPVPLRVDFAVDERAEAQTAHEPISEDKNIEPPPHFCAPGTLEFDFALRWRELQLAHKAEEERLAETHRQEREVLRQEQAQIYRHTLQKLKTVDEALTKGASWEGMNAAMSHSEALATSHMAGSSADIPHAKRARL